LSSKWNVFKPPGPPHPPENCTIKEGPKSQKFLICSPSYNGGLRQTFVLEVIVTIINEAGTRAGARAGTRAELRLELGLEQGLEP
jgi:hypothetical protein